MPDEQSDASIPEEVEDSAVAGASPREAAGVPDDGMPANQGPFVDAGPQRLANTFDWPKRCIFAGLGFVVVAGILISQQTLGWLSAVLVLAVVAACYCAWSWWRGQAWAEIDGDRLTLGNGRTQTQIVASDVVAVRHIMNRQSPDFTLVTTDNRRHTVRTSRLAKGHSSLFRWLLAHAPQATLDRGSVRTREMLENRGLLP
jgi:hypothetical protein